MLKKILSLLAVFVMAATTTSGAVYAATTITEDKTQQNVQAASLVDDLRTSDTIPMPAPSKTAPPKEKEKEQESPVEAAPLLASEPLPETSLTPLALPEPAPAPEPAIQEQALPAPIEPVPAPAPVPATGHGGLASAALAQLGIMQDCTRMVENALASIGRPVGDLAPAGFLSVGAIVAGPPQSGDILVYGGHVAIALGPDTAVHGGFNGGTTAIGPVDVGQGVPIVVRV